mmetsp:Transcript_23523/g.53990  ORF Transcript_23523/g.53990 Transcript_23523/m.53990 type:complete len:261 (-) Transcript_23523:577-1359(-)
MVPERDLRVWFDPIVARGLDVSQTMSERRRRTAVHPSLVPKGFSPRSNPRKVELRRTDSRRDSAPGRSIPLSPALTSWSLVSSRTKMSARTAMPRLSPPPRLFDDRSRNRTDDPRSAPWSPDRSDPVRPFELRSRYSSAADGLDRTTGQRWSTSTIRSRPRDGWPSDRPRQARRASIRRLGLPETNRPSTASSAGPSPRPWRVSRLMDVLCSRPAHTHSPARRPSTSSSSSFAFPFSCPFSPTTPLSVIRRSASSDHAQS